MRQFYNGGSLISGIVNGLDGGRFSSGASRETVDGLDLTGEKDVSMRKITVSFNGHTYPATLAE